jgi:hypothetical protein
MRKNIRIENPISGTGWTSRNRAKRFIAKGVAEWVEFGVSIRFCRAGDHQSISVQRSFDETRLAYDRAAGTGMAQIEDLANLPMVNPGRLLGRGRNTGASRRPL